MVRGLFVFLPALILATPIAHAAPATPPAATAPSDAASTPASSPLHAEILADYMTGNWELLEKTLKDKTRNVAGLSREEQADIIAVRLALKEGRQDWWAKTKGGGKIPIKVSLWGRVIPVDYDPKTRYGVEITLKNNLQALSVAWIAGDMDSTAPAEPGFTKGDSASLTAFANLGQADSWSQVTPVPASAEIPLERYLEFRGKLTGMAYGTPGARRYGLWNCLSSYNDVASKLQTRMADRAVAAMFLGELLTHPENYPSVTLPKTLAAEKTEETLCLTLADLIAKQPFTFPEDTALRTAVKQFAANNGSKAFTSATITLPNKLTVALDPKADGPALAQRNAWLKQQFDKLPPPPAK